VSIRKQSYVDQSEWGKLQTENRRWLRYIVYALTPIAVIAAVFITKEIRRNWYLQDMVKRELTGFKVIDFLDLSKHGPHARCMEILVHRTGQSKTERLYVYVDANADGTSWSVAQTFLSFVDCKDAARG
jgi:hypothetical protein